MVKRVFDVYLTLQRILKRNREWYDDTVYLTCDLTILRHYAQYQLHRIDKPFHRISI